jgi:hypothetical protein
VYGVRAGGVEGVQEGGVGAVETDQDPGEGGVQGLTAPGFVVPGPGGDRAGGGDLDEIADLLSGNGVVLDGRDKGPPITGLHPKNDALAQAGEKGALDRAEGASEGELQDEGGFKYFGHSISSLNKRGCAGSP